MFKDDCLQDHEHTVQAPNPAPNGGYDNISNSNGNGGANYAAFAYAGANQHALLKARLCTARTSTITHGKQKGVRFCIKAL